MTKCYHSVPYTLPRYYGSDESELKTDLDEKDQELLAQRVFHRTGLALQGPLVGDFVQMLDGTLRRFTHDWGDGLQVTWAPLEALAKGKKFFDGSFYLFKEGGASYSGGLDPSIPRERLELVEGELNWGEFWFFHHDWSGAHRGVHFKIACKTYRELPK